MQPIEFPPNALYTQKVYILEKWIKFWEWMREIRPREYQLTIALNLKYYRLVLAKIREEHQNTLRLNREKETVQ